MSELIQCFVGSLSVADRNNSEINFDTGRPTSQCACLQLALELAKLLRNQKNTQRTAYLSE